MPRAKFRASVYREARRVWFRKFIDTLKYPRELISANRNFRISKAGAKAGRDTEDAEPMNSRGES